MLDYMVLMLIFQKISFYSKVRFARVSTVVLRFVVGVRAFPDYAAKYYEWSDGT